MRLIDWLTENGISQAEFARRSGVEQPNVSRYANGSRRPNAIVLKRIEHATAGAVTANDFFEERDWKLSERELARRRAAAKKRAADYRAMRRKAKANGR
jgi:transcriptional regulator with XRE-family HTH domain